MGRLSAVLNINITVKQRIQLYAVIFGARGLWLLIMHIIKRHKNAKMLVIANVYLAERNARISAMKIKLPCFDSDKMNGILNASVD